MRAASGVRAILCCLTLLAAFATVWLTNAYRSRASVPSALPAISLWYWHTPFTLTPAETATLQRLGVQDLFVRTATLTYSGRPEAPVRATLAQTWKTPGGIRIHLVFPVDGTLVRRFEQIPEDVFADGVTKTIQAEQQRAKQEGITVAGIQLDLDCPTRLLPRYASVLKRIKAGFATVPLSITLLTSWYDSSSLAGVLDVVDFSVPQFYEAETARTHDQFHPISNVNRLKRGVRKAARLGKPFFVGLPIYGHALVYDGKGRLRGLFHDAGAADLLTRPEEFRFLESVPVAQDGKTAATPADFIGEEKVEFGPARTGTAFHLTYDLPTAEMLRRHLAMLRADLPSNCRGVVLYRFPERGEESVLPMATVEAVLHEKDPRPNLAFRLRTRRSAPFDLVEADDPARVPNRTDLYVTITNTGDGPSRIAPDAVEVTLRFQNATLESVRPGGFERIEGFVGQPENRASFSRADGLRLVTARIAPGEKRVVGPITLLPVPSTGTPSVAANWRIALPGGFEAVRGDMPPTTLPMSEEGK